MNKKRIVFLMLCTLIIMSVNVNAGTISLPIRGNLEAKHEEMSIWKSDKGYKFGKYTISVNDIEISEKYRSYASFKFETNSLYIESYYRFVNDQVGYAHVFNSYKQKKSGAGKTLKYTFFYDRLSCKEQYLPTSGNCTGKKGYEVKNLDDSDFVAQTNQVKAKVSYNYNMSANNTNEYTSSDLYKLSGNSLYRYIRYEAPRYANSNQVSAIRNIKFYQNGKKQEQVNYGNFGKITNRSKFSYQNRSFYNFNSQGLQVKSRVIHNMTKIYKGKQTKYYATTYLDNRTYHANKRLKQQDVVNRNKANTLTSSYKIDYRSNGRMIQKKVRIFYKGKLRKSGIYRFNPAGNIRGGAYRIVIHYNKRNQATKAYKQTYNKNGRLNKSYKIRVTKNLGTIILIRG